jgi:hypothetical protein
MAEPNIYKEPVDNLVAGTYPHLAVTSVSLAAGQGVLKRGTLLAPGDNGYVIMDTTTAGKAAFILADDTDTTAKTVAEVYRAGCFAEPEVIVKDGYTLTDADKDALRKYDIILVGEF